ncbi:MAG: LPS export ABC transporter periplasmic protein LptC [Pseudomonadota bacterium]
MNLKSLFMVIAALLLVVLGNKLTEEGVKQVDRHLTPAGPVQQDYYLNDVTITALNEQGQPQHRLQAKQLSHFTDSEQTRLQHPELVVFKQNNIEWRIVADRGEMNPQQDEVLLQGKVQLSQPSSDKPLQLTTEALRIQPKQGRANTDQPVTLIQADQRIDAVGLEVEQKSQRLRLLSQVRGHYEIPSP